MRYARCMAAVAAAAIAMPSGFAWAEPGPSGAGERSVRVEIDVKGLAGYEGFDPGVYESMARTTVTDALRERGYEVVTAGDGVTHSTDVVSLVLSWRDFDASSYELTYAVQRGGGERRTLTEHVCERCTDDELSIAVASHLDEALAELSGAASSSTGDPSVEADPGPAGRDEPPRPRLAPLAAVGLGVGVLGLGGVVAGAILVSKGDRVEPSPEGDAQLLGTDYTTPGIAVLVSGSVVLAAGVALVVVGQVRHARRGREVGRARIGWRPAIVRHGAGVSLAGRF
jgi:hypothetical protein